MKFKNSKLTKEEISQIEKLESSKDISLFDYSKKINSLKRANFWKKKKQKRLLDTCIEIDAYFSALVDKEFRRLDLKHKSYKEITRDEQEKIINSLMEAYKNSTYAEPAKKHFLQSALTVYQDGYQNVFTETVTRNISQKNVSKKRNQRDASGLSPASTRKIRSKILLPYLFFNYIIVTEIDRIKISSNYSKNTGYLRKEQSAEKTTIDFNLIYQIPDFPDKFNKKTINSTKNDIKKELDSFYKFSRRPKGRVDRMQFPVPNKKLHETDYFKNEFKNLSFILNRIHRLPAVIEVIKRGNLLNDFSKNIDHLSFLFLIYSLARSPFMFNKLYELNYIDFADLATEEIIRVPQSLIENRCFATLMLMRKKDSLFLTDYELDEIIARKIKRQKELMQATNLSIEDENFKKTGNIILKKSFFGVELHIALADCFVPKTSVSFDDVCKSINTYAQKVSKSYKEYLEAEQLRRECNNIARQLTHFYH